LIHDGDSEEVVSGGKLESLIPDWSFSSVLACSGTVALGAHLNEEVGILHRAIATMFEKS
jgi:hypothetical protein